MTGEVPQIPFQDDISEGGRALVFTGDSINLLPDDRLTQISRAIGILLGSEVRAQVVENYNPDAWRVRDLRRLLTAEEAGELGMTVREWNEHNRATGLWGSKPPRPRQ